MRMHPKCLGHQSHPVIFAEGNGASMSLSKILDDDDILT